MFSRLKICLDDLVNEILDYIPEEMFISRTTTFLDPCIGGGQFVNAVEQRLRSYGHSEDNIAKRVYGVESSNLRINYAINKHGLVGQYKACEDYLGFKLKMKFDVVLGNPPYQDGTKNGGQNKVYNQFAKKCLSLLQENGILALITPTSVLKESKRFTVIGIQGLKVVSYDASNYFSDVGVRVCYWLLDKNYNGDVMVKSNSICSTTPVGKPIYNPEDFSAEFINIYEGLKKYTKKPKDRMFKQNPVDASIKGRSKTTSRDHPYPVFKIDEGKITLVQYNKPVPKLYGQQKFVISMSKSLSMDACVVSDKDFDVNHMFIDVNSREEVDNIKSFIFSEYFLEHSSMCKKVDGYGFNNAIKFLPPFDKSKKWTSNEVREFIQSFSL